MIDICAANNIGLDGATKHAINTHPGKAELLSALKELQKKNIPLTEDIIVLLIRQLDDEENQNPDLNKHYILLSHLLIKLHTKFKNINAIWNAPKENLCGENNLMNLLSLLTEIALDDTDTFNLALQCDGKSLKAVMSLISNIGRNHAHTSGAYSDNISQILMHKNIEKLSKTVDILNTVKFYFPKHSETLTKLITLNTEALDKIAITKYDEKTNGDATAFYTKLITDLHNAPENREPSTQQSASASSTAELLTTAGTFSSANSATALFTTASSARVFKQ